MRQHRTQWLLFARDTPFWAHAGSGLGSTPRTISADLQCHGLAKSVGSTKVEPSGLKYRLEAFHANPCIVFKATL